MLSLFNLIIDFDYFTKSKFFFFLSFSFLSLGLRISSNVGFDDWEVRMLRIKKERGRRKKICMNY